MPTAKQTVKELIDTIGPTVTALVSGTRRQAEVDQWLAGKLEPTAAQLKRINFALEQLEKAAKQESAAVAAAWFIGGSIETASGEIISPAQAIRWDWFPPVKASLERLVHDLPM